MLIFLFLLTLPWWWITLSTYRYIPLGRQWMFALRAFTGKPRAPCQTAALGYYQSTYQGMTDIPLKSLTSLAGLDLAALLIALLISATDAHRMLYPEVFAALFFVLTFPRPEITLTTPHYSTFTTSRRNVAKAARARKPERLS